MSAGARAPLRAQGQPVRSLPTQGGREGGAWPREIVRQGAHRSVPPSSHRASRTAMPQPFPLLPAATEAKMLKRGVKEVVKALRKGTKG